MKKAPRLPSSYFEGEKKTDHVHHTYSSCKSSHHIIFSLVGVEND